MATNPDADVYGFPVDALLEKILREFVTGTRSESGANGHGSIMAALADAAMKSFCRIVAQKSEVERTLLARALAPALVDFLAPALARVLVPGIMAAMSRLSAASEQIQEVSERNDGKGSKSNNITNGSRSEGYRKQDS